MRNQGTHVNKPIDDAAAHFISSITTQIATYTNQDDLLTRLVQAVKEHTGFNAVGIRRADRYGNINFQAFDGFSEGFLAKEKILSLGDGNCLCMQAISGKYNARTTQQVTEYGSFWSNDFATFVENSEKEDKIHYRGSCLHEGFHSIAIIPLKTRNITAGTLNIAHPDTGMIQPALIQNLEVLAPLVGETIYRFTIEEELQHNNDIQEVLNELLRVSIERDTLQQILEKALELLVSLPWLSFQKKAAIFLSDESSGTFILKAHHGYNTNELKICETIRTGECLCGKALKEKRIIHTSTLNEDHVRSFDGIKPHGDYCIPIIHDSRVVGIINIQVADGHKETPLETSFLESVASTLSGILQLHMYMDQMALERERYEALIKQSSEGIFLFDPDSLRIIQANQAFMDMLGYTDNEIPSLLLTDIINAPRENILNNVQTAKNENAFTLEKREYIRSDGSIITVSVNSSVVTIQNKTSIMVNLHDISQQIKSEKLEKEYQQIRESLIQSARLLTGKLNVRDALYETVRLARELINADYGVIAIIEGQRISDIIQIGFSEEQVEMVGRIPNIVGTYSSIIKERKGIVFDDVATSPLFRGFPQGHPPVKSLVGTPVQFNENIFGMLLLGNKPESHSFSEYDREIIESLAAHAAVVVHNARIYEMLQSFNMRLEEKVHEQTRELREATIAAETANTAKTMFLANMSHELRTPLNAIIGFADVLKEQYGGPLNDEQLEYTGYILEGAKHLLDLINDILDISKVEAGKMELQPSDITIQELLDAGTFLIREKMLTYGIDFTLQIPEDIQSKKIRVDVRKMKQVIFNLLSNAFKYTEKGGSISISTSIEDTNLYIKFCDTGIGIEPEHIEKIFDEFYQVNTMRKGVNKQKGTGLGLPLSRKLVQLHAGELWAQSSGPGKGSTFILSIPLSGNSLTGESHHE
ncbi:MAG: GAF domain-containing protein [Spirochaetota bacterium]